MCSHLRKTLAGCMDELGVGDRVETRVQVVRIENLVVLQGVDRWCRWIRKERCVYRVSRVKKSRRTVEMMFCAF